jgi:hypothetical protein
LETGSTYPFTSSWSENVLSSSYSETSLTASYALTSEGGGGGGGLSTGSTYPITSSWALTASYSSATTLLSGSTYNITSSWSQNSISTSYSLSASYSSTASFSPNYQPLLTKGTLYEITSSWSEKSISSSFSSQSISSSYSITSSHAINATAVFQTVLTVGDGSETIQTGLKGYLRIPVNVIVDGWTIFSDQLGNISIDIWKSTYTDFPPTISDSIVGDHKPTLSVSQKNKDINLTSGTSFDIYWYEDDCVAFVVDGTPSSIKKVFLMIYGHKV